MALPVRLSVYDEGYDPLPYGPLIVFLDGVEQRDVVAYDTEAGVVSRLQRDGAGKLVRGTLGQFGVIEKARGKVEVMLKRVL